MPRRRKILLIIFAVVFTIFTAAYHLLLSSTRVERFLSYIVASTTEAELECKVSYASLIFGLDASSVLLKTKKEGYPILKADRIRLSMFTPSLLAGHAGIRELLIENPIFYITEHNGRWNIDALITGQTKKKEKTSDTDVIKTYLPLKFYAGIKLINSKLHIESGPELKRKIIKLENLNLHVAYVTKTFKEIPLNIEILDLFDTILFAFNPNHEMQIHIEDERSFEGKLKSSVVFYKDSSSDHTEFVSSLRFDSSNFFHIAMAQQKLPMDLSLSYDIRYDATADTLTVRKFLLTQNQNTWIDASANILHAGSGAPDMNLAIHKSEINLGTFSPFLTSGFGVPPVRGLISIAPLRISGKPDHLSIDASLAIKDFLLSTASGSHSIHSLTFHTNGGIDLYQLSSFFKKPETYRPANLAFNIFHELLVDQCTGDFNGGMIQANGSLHPEKGFLADLKILNFPAESVLSPFLAGDINFTMQASSTESLKEIEFASFLGLKNSRFEINRSRSGIMHSDLTTSGTIFLNKNAISIILNSVALQSEDSENTNTVDLLLASDLHRNESTHIKTDIKKLKVNVAKLYPILPGILKDQLRQYLAYLKDGFELHGTTEVDLAGDSTTIQSNLGAAFPSLRLDDIKLNTDLSIGKESIVFNKIHLTGLKNTLQAKLQGSIIQKNPDLTLSISLNPQQFLRIHENFSIEGSFHAGIKIQNHIAEGKIKAEELNVHYEETSCTDPPCQGYYIDTVNLDLPFRHNLKLKQSLRITDDPAYQSGLARHRPNFTIHSISAARNFQQKKVPDRFYIIGTSQRTNLPGFAARVSYEKNLLIIENLIALFFQNDEDPGKWKSAGLLSGNGIYFNLADGDPQNMEFRTLLHLQNLDLKSFLPESKSSYDGIISADLFASGKNLNDILYNMNAKLTVHRISKDFAGFATRIVMPDRLVAGVVNNTLEVPAISVEIRDGLVYSSINVKRGGMISLFIRPSGEEIRQERIPLARFLERAGREVKDFSEIAQ